MTKKIIGHVDHKSGMNFLEDRYLTARRLLRDAYAAAKVFMNLSQDEVAKVILEAEHRHVRNKLREFGRCQYGLGMDSAGNVGKRKK